MVRDEWRAGFAPTPADSEPDSDTSEGEGEEVAAPRQRRVSGLPQWERPSVPTPPPSTPPADEWDADTGQAEGGGGPSAKPKKRSSGRRAKSPGAKTASSRQSAVEEKRRVTVWVPARVFERLREEKTRRGVTFTTYVLDAFDRLWDRLDELFPRQQERLSPLPERRPGKRQSVEMPTQLHLLLTEKELSVIDGLGEQFVFASRSELITAVVERYLEEVGVSDG